MPALLKTQVIGKIIWLGKVADRAVALQSMPLSEIWAGFDGPAGEAHGGLTRPACSRVRDQYPRDTQIRNVRQFSILSEEELALIAADMGVAWLDPSLVGASMVVKGIPDFTHLPPSSRLQASGGATLVLDMENRACTLPAKPIEAVHRGFGKTFKSAAQGRRGVTAWVEREGLLKLGADIQLHVPDQPLWSGYSQIRATDEH
jgi:hypothetical protein